jgi:hypothetical protein
VRSFVLGASVAIATVVPNASAAPPLADVGADRSAPALAAPAQPLDAAAAWPGRATPATQIGNSARANVALLWASLPNAALDSGAVGLLQPGAWSLFGGAASATGHFAVTGSQLRLQPPAILGIQPLIRIGTGNPLYGLGGFGEIGGHYAIRRWHLGWQLRLADSFGYSAAPAIASTSYLRYVAPRWNVGVDHVAMLGLRSFPNTRHVVDVAGGVQPKPGAPSARAFASFPLRPLGTPSGRGGLLGTF